MPQSMASWHPLSAGRGDGKGSLFGGSGGGGGGSAVSDGLDDELGLGDLLLSLSKLASEIQKPDTRK
jgi:hypothetical protein